MNFKTEKRMSTEGKKILKGRFSYFLSKVAPKNTKIKIGLKNGIEFIVRAKTMDKSILKEVWITKIYDKYGIKVEKGDTVIDIGAQIGFFSIYAAELSKTGKVYAFEPFIENFQMLEKHKLINKKENLFVYNVGVSDKEGRQTLYLSPDNNTGGHSLHLKTDDNNKKIEIQTIRLNDFCEKENISTIDFLKLDCEGAEFDILKSNEGILANVDKIIMECHPYENNTVDDMVKLLERNGFSILSDVNSYITGVTMLYARKMK